MTEFKADVWYGEAGEILGEQVFAEIFERQAYIKIKEALTEQSLEEILMMPDTSQVDALDDELLTIQWPDLMAAGGGKISDEMTSTIRPPETNPFDTYLWYALASYEPKVANKAELMTSRDIAARAQLISRKNWVAVKGVVDEKANQLDHTTTGTLTFADLLNIHADVAERGWVADTFLTTPKLLADLLKDPQTQQNDMNFLMSKIDKREGQIWEVRTMGWTVVASRHMIDTDISGTNFCIGFDMPNFTVLGYSRELDSVEWNKATAGGPILQGMTWFEQYGVGRYYYGDDACAYIDVTTNP